MKNFKAVAYTLGFGLLAAANGQAATVTTPPVGARVLTIQATSDTHVGLALHRASELNGKIASTNQSTVTINIDLADDFFINSNETYYILFKDGTLEGQWFTILDNESNSITVDTSHTANLESLGLEDNTLFQVIPFSTLNTVFPNGQGIPHSANPFSPSAFVFFQDIQNSGVNRPPDKAYLYHDGSVLGVAGWYDNSNLFAGIVDNTPITPETYITIRNQTINAYSFNESGMVPSTKISNSVTALTSTTNDNLISNPYPVELAINTSDLNKNSVVKTSTNPFSPTDFLLIYPEGATGYNLSPTRAYFYHDGNFGVGGPGWYDNNNIFAGPIDDSITIPPGGAFIIRKASASDQVITWTPPMPYSL